MSVVYYLDSNNHGVRYEGDAPNPNWVIVPPPVNGQDTWDAVNQAWIPHVSPDPNSFEVSIFQDQTLTVEAKLSLMTFFPLVDKHQNDVAMLQAAWSMMQQAFGSTWLTPAVVAIVQAYADACHLQIH